jgi:CxxC motif-containing protein (DUF1111 family)
MQGWTSVVRITGTVLVLCTLSSCRKDDMPELPIIDGNGYEPGEELSGGDGTTFDFGLNAFNHPASNLTNEEDGFFVVGNSFFTQNWVIAPSSTEGRDGLGPLFNAQSCSGCHVRDGRGRPPLVPSEVSGLLFRLSVPGVDNQGGPVPHPLYGEQLQPFGIQGVPDEATVQLVFDHVNGSFNDGTAYELETPNYVLNGNYGSLDDALISPRIAQQMCGIGLLEAITAIDLMTNAQTTTDGISGRLNWVWDVEAQQAVPGRFGWKANMPNVRQQVAGAFNGDIGITSRLFPQDHCTSSQPACINAPNGNSDSDPFELKEHTLNRVTFYAATLGVPARRRAQDPNVLDGKRLFSAIGCGSCHRAKYTTGPSIHSDALSGQVIYPYTDLLLHDMGPGLADGRSDFLADGTEWRTPPLWGIGLFQTTNGHTRYLHDGRARDLNEAILWHGGEAQLAQQRYIGLSSTERAALLSFLNSL